MVAGGWELESDAGTDDTIKMGASDISADALYDAGLYGCAKFSSAGKAGLSPEEEENFKWESVRAEITPYKPPPDLSEKVEKLVRSFPTLYVGVNDTTEGEGDRPPQEVIGSATTKPCPQSALGSCGHSSCGSPAMFATKSPKGKEKEALKKSQAEHVKTWLIMQI